MGKRRLKPSQFVSPKTSFFCRWYRCHHNTRYDWSNSKRSLKDVVQNNPLKRFKDTQCPFKMSIKISQKGDHPCEIEIQHNHNHAVSSLQSLSYKDISEEVREEIRTLYKEGMQLLFLLGRYFLKSI